MKVCEVGIQQAVKESQAAICVAEYEADPTNFKVSLSASLFSSIPLFICLDSSNSNNRRSYWQVKDSNQCMLRE